MRRLLLALTLLPVVACSYSYMARTSLDADPVMLDHVTSSRSFLVSACWVGEGEPDDAELTIFASVSDGSQVSIEFAEQRDQLAATPPDEVIAPAQYWAGEQVDDACSLGSVVTFELEQGGVEPVEIEWSIQARVTSSFDQAVEQLELSIDVQEL